MKVLLDENLPRRLASYLTLDKNVPYQQNLASRRIGILIIRARSSRMQDLVPLIPACLSALTSIKPGEVIRLAD